MKNLIYFGIFAIALTVSANANAAAAVATEATIRSISYTTLSECEAASLSAGGSSCIGEAGGYYYTPVTTFDVSDVTEFEAIDSELIVDDGDTGTTTTTKTTATVNTCTSDMTLSSDGCCCVMK